MFAICNLLRLHSVLTGSDVLILDACWGRYQTFVVLVIYTPDNLAALVNVARAGARWPQASSGNLIGCIFSHMSSKVRYAQLCSCNFALMHEFNGGMDTQTRPWQWMLQNF